MLNGNEWGVQNSPFNMKIGTSARLFVFTPMVHNTQVARSYVYNFNNNLVDVMVNNNSALEGIRNVGNLAYHEAITNSILPSTNGLEIDVSNLDNMWSFVLILDHADPVRSEIAFGGPKRRTILTGYFFDEPIVPSTLYSSNPVFNPNAVLLFTHVNSVGVNVGNIYGASPTRNVNVFTNADIVPQAVAAWFPQHSNDLTLCDIGSIARSFSPDDYSNVSIANGNPITIGGFQNIAPMLSESTKIPRRQLMDIARAADHSKVLSNDDFNLISDANSGGLLSGDMYDVYIQTMYANIQSPESRIHQGIDPTRPMLLRDLDNTYPYMEVIPCQVPYKPEYDIKDQRCTDISTVFSSLVKHNVEACATEAMLSSISFTYNSWIRDETGKKGCWEIHQPTSLMITGDLSDTALEKSIFLFMQNMELGLFPILINMSGEFNLNVSHDSIAATAVDLNFLDYSNRDNGIYVAHNRIGGAINPSVGPSNIMEHNRSSFDNLVSTLATENMQHGG